MHPLSLYNIMQKTWIRVLVRSMGVAAILAGLLLILLGPAELACFPMFNEGGRFHFAGFAYGSLIYAVILGQVIVYPLMGSLLVVIGYGHIKGHAWVVGLMRGLSLTWLLIGLPVMPVLLFLTLSFKEITAIPLVIVIGLLVYPIGPLLLRRLYRAKWLQCEFETGNPVIEQLEWTVTRVSLLGFGLLAAIACLLFRGLMPFFGLWLHGITGLVVSIGFLLVSSTLLILNIKPTHNVHTLNLAYTIGALIAATLTVLTFDWLTVLDLTHFANVEKDAMLNVPIQGIHLAITLLPPLVAILIWQLKHPVKKTL